MGNLITRHLPVLALVGLLAAGCAGSEQTAVQQEEQAPAQSGDVEVLDQRLTELIDPSAMLEVLGDGFVWTEGPVWVAEHQFLLFSDVPTNTIHKWAPGEGVTEYLNPSGYTGEEPRGGEMGSNGLFISNDGHLLLCQHGDQRIARMDAPLDDPIPDFTTIAGTYNGNSFNSPNDLVQHSNGDIYFTDPPYGLEGGPEASAMGFFGVYRVDTEGNVTLLTNELSRPNGIELSPDEQTLYVAISSGQNPVWMAYDVQDDGTIANGRIFGDASEFAGKEPGSQDGMDVDADGNVYATGPGGVWIFSPEGTLLGKIKTGKRTSNCTIGQDGKTLFMTVHHELMSIPLK